jgi:uncharacterized protein (TIGR02996 family)
MAGNSLTGLLGRALTALGQHDDDEVLECLLEAWRESRDERIAALLERRSARLAAAYPPFGNVLDFPLRKRLRPMTVPLLLPELMEAAESGDADAVSRQLDRFVHGHPDPRLIPSLRAISRLPLARGPAVLTQLWRLLFALRDSSALEILRVLRAHLEPGSFLDRRIDSFLKQEGPHEFTRLNAKARALCDALEEAMGAREEAEARSAPVREALLARVYAQPDDDSARLVLADHLQEQGDPWGEFIMLQLTSPAPTDRMTELVSRYGAKWQAALEPHIDLGHTRFERGFPVAVQMIVESGQVLSPPGPAWATVREIHWAGHEPVEMGAWLAHPHLRGVTRLAGVRAALGRQRAAQALPVRELRLLSGIQAHDVKALRALSRLPRLACVEIEEAEVQDVELCAGSPLAQRLERFVAEVPGKWLLVATPREEVTVEVTLRRRSGVNALAEALRAATGFGTRALRLRSRCQLRAEDRRKLEAAGKAYARIEWA